MKKYIDFFDEYTNYYMNIAKNDFQKIHINRKIEHSKRVNKISIEIAKKLNLNSKEIYLINIASLLHDIGRFKQFYEFNTYIDEISYNHALKGIDVLEEKQILNELEPSEKEIILEIIKLHNYKELPINISDNLRLYASIVRDADKIDWIYAMINIIPNLSKENQAIFYSNKKDTDFISKKTVDLILQNKKITKSELATIGEVKVSAISWIVTSMECWPSFEIIKREDLINKTSELIKDSKEKKIIFEHIKNELNKKYKFMNNKI